MIKYLIIGTAIFLFGVGGIDQLMFYYSVRSNTEPVRSEQEIEQTKPNTEQTSVRENQRVIVQVNDFVIVGAICKDGSSAKLYADRPPAVIYSCE